MAKAEKSISRYVEYQSSNLATGEGLDKMDMGSPGKVEVAFDKTHERFVGLTLRNTTRDFHVITANIVNDKDPSSAMEIGFINNYTHHPVKLMVTPPVKAITIGSIYGSQQNDGPVEIYVDSRSSDPLELFLVGTYDKNSQDSGIKPNDYSALAKIIDPQDRCKVIIQPFDKGTTITAHYEHNGLPVEITGDGSHHSLPTDGH